MDPIDLASARMRRQVGYRPSSGRPKWQKYLAIAALIIGLAWLGLHVFREIRAELAPGEGELCVNVNTAMQKELETISGIGPFLARGIIRGRPYARVDDLERVNGIGKYKLNEIRPYVRVDGETEKYPCSPSRIP
jgi:competence protein ComEA